MKNPMKQQSRKPYRTPKLRVYGSQAQIVHAKFKTSTESAGGSKV